MGTNHALFALDRAMGVEHIVSHTCRAAKGVGIDGVSFYGVDGRFRDPDDALRDVDLVAAANWHALASFVAKEIAPDAVLVDIGSTTTDMEGETSPCGGLALRIGWAVFDTLPSGYTHGERGRANPGAGHQRPTSSARAKSGEPRSPWTRR